MSRLSGTPGCCLVQGPELKRMDPTGGFGAPHQEPRPQGEPRRQVPLPPDREGPSLQGRRDSSRRALSEELGSLISPS